MAEAAPVSSGTSVLLSPGKINFPQQLLRVAKQAAHLSHFFLNGASSCPTQRVGTQPTCPRVEDSLLKRRTCTYPWRYQPAYLFGIYGTHPLQIDTNNLKQQKQVTQLTRWPLWHYMVPNQPLWIPLA